MFAAPCDSCGKEWKVPSAGRVYRCRACDGRVTTDPAPHAEPDTASEPAVESRLCRDCGRPIDDESEACVDCSVKAAPAGKTRRANRFQDALLGGRVKERMRKGVAFTQTLLILQAVTMGALLFLYFAAAPPRVLRFWPAQPSPSPY